MNFSLDDLRAKTGSLFSVTPNLVDLSAKVDAASRRLSTKTSSVAGSLAMKELAEFQTAIDDDPFIGNQVHLKRFLQERPHAFAALYGLELDPEKLTVFTDAADFSRATFAYCLEKYEAAHGFGSHRFRSPGRVTVISRETQGDLRVAQVRTSDDKPFVTSSEERSISYFQDSSPFLALILRYAAMTRQRSLPIIKNWREIFEEMHPGTIASAEDGVGKLSGIELAAFFDGEIVRPGKPIKTYPATHSCGTNSNLRYPVLPVVDNNDLVLLRLKKGQMPFSDRSLKLDETEFREMERVRLRPGDLTETIKGIFLTYTRAPTNAYCIMQHFSNN